MIGKFCWNGDEASATLLEIVIYLEEIMYCVLGLCWFKYLYVWEVDGGDVGEEIEESGVVKVFYEIVCEYFYGAFKLSFNDEVRVKVGFMLVWYEFFVIKVYV